MTLTDLSDVIIDRYLDELSIDDLTFMADFWGSWGRSEQQPPDDNWRTWIFMGGRGAGKTRAGAEWVRCMAQGRPPITDRPAMRMALVGQTMADARDVMVEGDSGILAVHPDEERPVFEPSRGRLTWHNGAQAQLFSAETPAALRGPQFDGAWCDEISKWRKGRETWDMLQFALRLGDRPRQVVTTTPRPSKLLKEILEDPATRNSHATTLDNDRFLAEGFLQQVMSRYAGTRLGRQEIDGELIEDREDALWTRHQLEELRVSPIQTDLHRIVVAIDPPTTSNANSDMCGIITAARTANEEAVVLADNSLQGAAPLEWARAAVAAYHDHGADMIVAEVNQGGDMVETILRQIDPAIPLRKVHATRGKWLRAEPVAALYAQARVRHAGAFAELEDQMCDFALTGLSSGRSPDRLDALVWAITELMLSGGSTPRVRTL